MYNIAVFVSGRGSNLSAIVECRKEELKTVRVKAVFSNNPVCYAFEIAKKHSIPSYVVSAGEENSGLNDRQLSEILVSLNINLIVLAGYLKKIPENIIEQFSNKIINIHPALLPSFGGKGMYGINVHKAVFQASQQVSGATVHFVNNNFDEGKIIAQKAIDINGVSSPEEIAEKVLRIEHEILPYVIGKFATAKVIIENGRVKIV